MDNAFVRSTQDVLREFGVTENAGLSQSQIIASRQKHGRNGKFMPSYTILTETFQEVYNNQSIDMYITAIPEDPPTPLWELILEQFKDQLVLILLGSAAISFVLALFEDGEGWTAFVDPIVVCRLSMIST